MSGHTKGPWRVDGRFVYGAGRKFPLAEFPPHGVVHSGVDAANARLMAAAPELLQALKWLMEDFYAVNEGVVSEETSEFTSYIAANAAIAKAEAK